MKKRWCAGILVLSALTIVATDGAIGSADDTADLPKAVSVKRWVKQHEGRGQPS
jgi:hypothetical protein